MKSLVYVALLLLMATCGKAKSTASDCYMTNPCADHLGQGEDFTEPAQLRSNSSSWSVNLTVDIGSIKYDWLTLKRRLYNGSPCGPTINVKKGDVLQLDLVNNLSSDGNRLGTAINRHNHPNTTNIHTHGLHISSKRPQDNVLISVDPKSHFQYRYQIDVHNAPGTYWYHAHVHGSTTLQVNGGLAGILIVEDKENEMAAELAAASCPNNCDKDIQLIFQPLLLFGGYFGYGNVQKRNADYIGFRNDRYMITGGRTLTGWLQDHVNYFTTNGQLHPKLQLQTGQMYRFRMVNAGGGTTLEVNITDSQGRPTSNCDIREIALDGIYLPSPRPLHNGQSLLVQASRVDWLVKCNVPGIYKIMSFHDDVNNSSLGFDNCYNGVLATLEVSGVDAKSSFPTVLPEEITHLSDSTNVDEADIDERYVVEFNPWFYMNRELWNGSQNCRYKMRLGQVQEWHLLNTDSCISHPFHMHVNHFQVISYNKYTGGVGMLTKKRDWYLNDVNDINNKCFYQRKGYIAGENPQQPSFVSSSKLKYLGHEKRYAEDTRGTLGYARVGEWRDTIIVPPLANITIRFVPSDFTGVVILHCHNLEHEDRGMMMLVEVVNQDESTDANIKSGNAYPGTCRKCDRYPPNNATDLCGTTNG